MPLPSLLHFTVTQELNKFLQRRRPIEEIRNEVDIACRIINQSVFIFELRPQYKEPYDIIEFQIAKATFVNTTKEWKIYWQKADLKWYSYSANPTVKTFQKFIDIVEQDEFSCFWG